MVDVTSEKGKINSYEIPVSHYGYVKVNAINADTNEVIADNDISVNLYRGVENAPFKTLTLEQFGTYYRQGKLLEDSTITVELVFPTGTYKLDKLLLNANGASTEVPVNNTGTYKSQYSQALSRDGMDLTYVLTVRTGNITVTDNITNAFSQTMYGNDYIAGKGMLLASQCIEKGVDPYVAVAIMLHETGCKWTCSKLARNYNNVGGIYNSSKREFYSYESQEKGVQALLRNELILFILTENSFD
mgnify:CR=1 FL=1